MGTRLLFNGQSEETDRLCFQMIFFQTERITKQKEPINFIVDSVSSVSNGICVVILHVMQYGFYRKSDSK